MSSSNSQKVLPKYFHFSTVGSTQDEAARLLLSGEQPPFVVSADVQTQGRGRVGRTWVTEKDRSIAFTLVYRSDSPFVSGLSLVVGLGALDALKIPELQLKWPNDLMLNDSKVGGILIESKSQGSTIDFLIGLGLNLRSLQSAQYAGIDKEVSLHHLAESVLEKLVKFSPSGFSAFKSNYEAVMWRRGEEVTYSLQTQKLQAQILGVNDEGALILTSGGKLSLNIDGEILHER